MQRSDGHTRQRDVTTPKKGASSRALGTGLRGAREAALKYCCGIRGVADSGALTYCRQDRAAAQPRTMACGRLRIADPSLSRRTGWSAPVLSVSVRSQFTQSPTAVAASLAIRGSSLVRHIRRGSCRRDLRSAPCCGGAGIPRNLARRPRVRAGRCHSPRQRSRSARR